MVGASISHTCAQHGQRYTSGESHSKRPPFRGSRRDKKITNTHKTMWKKGEGRRNSKKTQSPQSHQYDSSAKEIYLDQLHASGLKHQPGHITSDVRAHAQPIKPSSIPPLESLRNRFELWPGNTLPKSPLLGVGGMGGSPSIRQCRVMPKAKPSVALAIGRFRPCRRPRK